MLVLRKKKIDAENISTFNGLVFNPFYIYAHKDACSPLPTSPMMGEKVGRTELRKLMAQEESKESSQLLWAKQTQLNEFDLVYYHLT